MQLPSDGNNTFLGDIDGDLTVSDADALLDSQWLDELQACGPDSGCPDTASGDAFRAVSDGAAAATPVSVPATEAAL